MQWERPASSWEGALAGTCVRSCWAKGVMLILVRLVILPNLICTLEYYSDNLAYTLSIIAMGDTEFISSPRSSGPRPNAMPASCVT